MVSILARVRDDDPHRGPHLGVAAASGAVALPAVLAARLGVGPPPVWWLVLAGVVVVAALVRAARVRAPVARAAPLLALGGALLAGSFGVLAVAAVWAGVGETVPPLGSSTADAIYDIDARVATRPLPACRPSPARIEVLAGRGAHPRLAPDGASVWYDAPGPEGRRQIHQLLLADRSERCWTCGEPGNNRRPAPDSSGGGVIFDTDRFATWGRPMDTELQLLNVRHRDGHLPSRRISYSPGSDDHAVPIPGANGVVWSRSLRGRNTIVSASLRGGHGSLMLGPATVVASPGTAWAAPLAWSPDARALVMARGNPWAPLHAELLDPATGRLTPGGPVVGSASAGFSADGGWMVLADARRVSPAGLLPRGLGFALEPIAERLRPDGPSFQGTWVRVGETGGELADVPLGEQATWGAPTGVSLAPDGRSFVLGQRREADGRVEERLLRVLLACGD